jgi:long-chain acyl-CoA synthetase
MSYSDKPWLKSYKIGPYPLDHSLAPYPELPLYQVLDQAAERYPTQTAILFQGRTLKYHQFKSQADRLAAALVGLGLGKGERVCIFLPNCIEFLVGYWAVIKVGGIVVPTSVLRTDEGLLHEVGSSGSRMVICREESLERVLAIREKTQVEWIIVTSEAGYDLEGVSIALPPHTRDFRQLLNAEAQESPQIEIDPQQDLCELAFTGGATGVPKGVMLSHTNRHSVILQGLPWFMKPMLRGIAGKASVLLAISLFHTMGNYIQLSAVYLGLRIVLLPDPRDTQEIARQIQETRPFLIPGVPTQFMRLADTGLRRVNTMLFSGAAPLPQEVAAEIKRKTGMPISEGYGLTETSATTHINLSAFSRIFGFMAREKHGIGLPTPDTECKLVDPQDDREVPFGEPGEIVVRGLQVMRGYWPEVGSGLAPGGWLHTGDIAVMDEDGYFQLVDRIKDMVNVSGMKVYTTEVDEVLFKHPSVLMAAAFGVPDPEMPGSERVMAAVQLKDEQQSQVSAQEIKDFCRQHLPPYAVPINIEFRQEMPLTVTEKVFKKALREEAISRMKEGRQAK